jgi:hypothetical protein
MRWPKNVLEECRQVRRQSARSCRALGNVAAFRDIGKVRLDEAQLAKSGWTNPVHTSRASRAVEWSAIHALKRVLRTPSCVFLIKLHQQSQLSSLLLHRVAVSRAFLTHSYRSRDTHCLRHLARRKTQGIYGHAEFSDGMCTDTLVCPHACWSAHEAHRTTGARQGPPQPLSA